LDSEPPRSSPPASARAVKFALASQKIRRILWLPWSAIKYEPSGATAKLVADRIGPERTAIRISPGQNVNDISEHDEHETYPALLKQLSQLGLAYVHVLESPPDTGWSAIDLVRANFDGTLIANSNFLVDWPPEVADQLLSDGRADLYCYGRRFISNPDLVERIRIGADLNEADPATFYGGGAEGYTDYPFLATS
jgi:N-ethylmaleimide reductase